MTVVPTPEVFRGRAVEILDDKCGTLDCEYWHVTECAAIKVESKELFSAGLNWGNADPLAAAGRRPIGPVLLGGARYTCTVSPMFSRVAVVVPFVKGADPTGQPIDSVPPPLHFEVRVGDDGAVSRVARAVWTPNGWRDFGYLVEVSGFLASRVEIWGWCELTGDSQALPYLVKFNLLIDRRGDGKPTVFYNALANVVEDTT